MNLNRRKTSNLNFYPHYLSQFSEKTTEYTTDESEFDSRTGKDILFFPSRSTWLFGRQYPI
jgi:hypothetical protein